MSATERFDFLIVGSGFGGSVSALRLAEKGYSVAVLEAGKRWRTEDFPKTNWSVHKFLYLPELFCHGIQRLTLLDDVLVLSGAGVGGGSLVYANTLLVPPAEAFRNVGWPEGEDWQAKLAPHYATAQRMLGANEVPRDFPADLLLKRAAEKIGRGDTFHRQTVGVYFGEPGKKHPDPYFGGAGPERAGCTFCGGCMTGCKVGAKNTLDKNYLYLAEQKGCRIIPETKAELIRPLENGYAVDTVSTVGFRKKRRSFHADRVILSAGVLGTLKLLMRCREAGTLDRLSERLGQRVRTNSESIIGATARKGDVDYSEGIAIGSSVHIDEITHVEAVRYQKGSDAMAVLGTLLVDGGGKIPRFVRWLGEIGKHPIDFLRTLLPFGWAKRSVILLVMQAVDSSIDLKLRRGFRPLSSGLASSMAAGEPPIPTYLPAANSFARVAAELQGGLPSSSINEALLNVPLTAHVLGGCRMAKRAEDGVIDERHEVFGHPGLFVVDGSAVPSNLGVNPSLTITALAEHAMSQIPPKGAP